MLNYKELNYLLKQNHFDPEVLQDKLLCIYHSLTMEVSLPQIINTKKHTKTVCLSRVVNMLIEKRCNFIMVILSIFTR